MITFENSGSFKNTEAFLQRLDKEDIFRTLEPYARQGVEALSKATPVDSGLTAGDWYYEITKTKGSYRISWMNRNMAGDTPVAILLQYGHGTGTGGYVQGRDYINPAIKPIFDKIADKVWKVVTST